MLMTTGQAAGELGISVRRVQALIESKRLHAIKPGRDYLIMPADLDKVRDRPPGRPRKQEEHSGNSSKE